LSSQYFGKNKSKDKNTLSNVSKVYRFFKPNQSPPVQENHLKEVVHGFKPKQSPNSPHSKSTLEEWFMSPDFKKYLFSSNIFIYGKIGFYGPVLDKLLTEAFPAHTSPVKIYRKADIDTFLSLKGMEKKPFVFMPTVGNDDDINDALIQLLENNNKIWLVSYPSLLSKSLLSVFNAFFLACGATDIQSLRDVISFSDAESPCLSKNAENEGFFSSDYHSEKDKVKTKYRTPFYLSELD